MEHASFHTLVVITLLQLCRAQSTGSTPEWYAANDINDSNFSPKPITELFSTETSFSPDNPIVVLPPSSPSPANPGVVSSPSPTPDYSDSTFPPNVIPLSSPETPSDPSDYSQSTQSETRPSSIPQIISTISQQPFSTESTVTLRSTQSISQLLNRPGQIPRLNNVRQIPTPNRMSTRQTQPQNIQFMLPPQVGNRNLNPGFQLPSNVGQPNYIVLYQKVPQTIQNIPLASPQGPSQSLAPPSQRDPVPQPITVRNPNMIGNRPITQQPNQNPNQFLLQPNAIPPFNNQPSNTFPSQQTNSQPPFNLQQNNGTFINRPFNSQPNNNQGPINQQPINQQPINQQQINQQQINQQPINQQPNNQQPINQQPINQQPINQQPNNQFPMNQPPLPSNNFNDVQPPLVSNEPGMTQRPYVRTRQRTRVNSGRLNNRGPNQMQPPNAYPCQKANKTIIRPITKTATKPKNPVITIRLKPSVGSQANLKSNPSRNTIKPPTVNPRPNAQVNSKNYERCLNSCKDKKDRICAAPYNQTQINPDLLKGFPSMCHMACHNTFRANPIYGKISNGRCGKLRTRIQTVDKNKVKRDDLKKTEYTIISNVPGTVVELAE